MPMAGACSGVRENWVTSHLGGTVSDEEKVFSRGGRERARRGGHHVQVVIMSVTFRGEPRKP